MTHSLVLGLRSWGVVLLVAVMPSIAEAQSLFGSRGLGVPTEGYDARARALGVSGVGLLGLTTSLINPAEPAGILRRGVSAAFQPWSGSFEVEGEEDDISATRFPLISIFYPTRFGVFTLGYAAVLEQSWAVISEGREIVGTDTVLTRDLLQHTGGIGQLRLGLARRLNETVSVGGAVGLYTGNIDRGIRRAFPDSSELGYIPFESHTRWSYTGPLASLGVRWDPGADLRLGATFTWSGTLKAKPTEGSDVEYEYDMPLRFDAGASGRIGRNLVAALSGSLTTWTSDDYRTPGSITATAAEKQVEIGGGLEYTELRSGTRIFPLRIGARTTKLPFHFAEEEAPSEWAIRGGIGFRLVEDDFGPLAVADVGAERVSREGLAGNGGNGANQGGLQESFWRFTISVSLFGR
jgi:hypothetical protein